MHFSDSQLIASSYEKFLLVIFLFWVTCIFPPILFFLVFIYLFWEGEREREKGRENPKQAPCPTQGSIPQTMRSWPELKSRVGRLTDWTPQASLGFFVFKHFSGYIFFSLYDYSVLCFFLRKTFSTVRTVFVLFYFYFKFFMFIFERDREQSVNRGGAEREGDTECEAGPRLWAVSRKRDTGLEPTNLEIMTWAEVGRQTNWATQVPLFCLVFFF